MAVGALNSRTRPFMSSKNWAASNGVGKKVVWLVGQFGFVRCCLQACAVSMHWGGALATANNSHTQTKLTGQDLAQHAVLQAFQRALVNRVNL
jgi:hypothetical protein